MNTDKQNEIIAKIALSEFERKNKLNKIIDESFWHYYFANIGNLVGIIIFIIIFALNINTPNGLALFGFGFVIFIIAELCRQNHRFEALIKLREIEKIENENEIASPNSDTAATKPE